MLKEDNSEIKLIYDINMDEEYEEDEEQIINIFGAEFVENNKNICKMLIDNKEYEISEKYNIANNNNNIIEVKLKRINNFTNMSNIN